MPGYSLNWLHDRFLEDTKFNRLFDEWVKSKYDKYKKPSIDRINHNKPYTKENIQIMSWGDNRYKQRMERRARKGAVLQMKDGLVIARYISQREAVKITGIPQGLISSVLTGKRTHTNGYQFVYENQELLNGGKEVWLNILYTLAK